VIFRETQSLKGILHPKMKILSSFTHPQVVSNLYEFLSSAEHKGRYFEELLEPMFSTINFHSRKQNKTMKVIGDKISSFVFSRRKKPHVLLYRIRQSILLFFFFSFLKQNWIGSP